MKEIEISSISAIEHLLANRPDRLKRIRILTSKPGARIEKLTHRAKEFGIHIEMRAKLGREIAEEDPVRAWVGPFPYTELGNLISLTSKEPRAIVLALDHLQDPQNFGAICRTAEALGILGIVIPRDRAASVGSGVYHASAGAVDTIPIVMVANLGEALRKFKEDGFWILGSTLSSEGTDVNGIPTFEKIVLVMGAELEGLSTYIEKLCDWRVRIPLLGRVQSLNVSVAGGILMHYLKNRLSEKQN